MKDELIGFIEFQNEHYPFSYNDWKLKIYLEDDKKFFDYVYEKDANGKIYLPETPKKLNESELNAIDSNNNRFVKFKLLDSCLRGSYNTPGPSYLVLNVEYYSFINASRTPGDETVITLWSNELGGFLGVKPHYLTDIIEGKLDGRVFCESETLKMMSESEFDGKHLTISPTFRITNSINNFTFEAGLNLKVNKSLSINDIYTYVLKLLEAVYFDSSRKNVDINEITFRNWTDEGTMIIRRDYEAEFKKAEHPRDELMIPWRVIHPGFANLLVLLLKDEIFISHLQEKKIERYFVNDTTIARDCSAFEAEFRYTFGTDTFESDEKTKEIENEVEAELSERIENSTGKKKKIYKGFKKHVHQQSLTDKIYHCLEMYKKPLESLLKSYVSEYELIDIAETCGGIRNVVDHGKKKRTENPVPEPEAFFTLRALIYTMQLKRIGLDDDSTKTAIEYLYKIYE